ncbi:hypothetical protein [Xylocopilactobacillus apicola]|uniref:Uncharacterized protein n=1 Tax=Xylocopilactobacillus apicola TaxID=2932184 RepID=A0AAU9DL87_9LACO|nr:hypothetical protein [Xylocopilactobacillus apicola]BDR59326.1 hypothetical protein XA3_17670 [Xylocopilactobacillus apicola]
MYVNQFSHTRKAPVKTSTIIIKEIPNAPLTHGFPDIVDNYAGFAKITDLGNAKLYQIQGSQDGVIGRFEWIVQDGRVTQRIFLSNGGPIK